MKKIISTLCLTFLGCCTMGLMACNTNGGEPGTTELSKTLPEEIVCGKEIYFKEYLPIDFDAEYELTVSYFDCTRLEQVKNEKLDSLMFRFEDVSKYDFKLNKVGAEPISFSINCVPVEPELSIGEDWQTDKGETVLLDDLMFWGNINLKDEAAQIDPAYKVEFVDVTINSAQVEGTSETVNLIGASSYTFDQEAEYVFTLKASNISGASETKLKVTTMDLNNHSNDVCGYIFDDSDSVEFDVASFEGFANPENAQSIKVRIGTEKYDAVYNAATNSFTVSDFTQDIAKGVQERMYITDANDTAYSVNIVIPDLIVTKANFKELELITDGVVILAEDINMSEIENYGSSRDGKNYKDYYFKGTFDGRGHTISNYKTKAGSYVGSLFWSVQGSTIKNVIFKNATVLKESSVVSGRTGNDSKFINIAIEVDKLTTTNAAAISGPSEHRGYYENCLIYVKEGDGSVVKSGFFGGLYCRSIEVVNSYIVSNLYNLPTSSEGHSGIVTAITGTVNRMYISAAKAKYDSGNNWGSAFLSKAATAFFNGITPPADPNPDAEVLDPGPAITSKNIKVLLTATEGEYYLTEDIDLKDVAWVPKSTFKGTLDGKGFKISNLNGSLFKAVDGAKISNLILDNVTDPAKGVFTTDNIGKDVVIENVIVQVASAAATRIALLGYQTGGTATLKNVVVDMFAFEKDKDYKGFLTAHAGGKQILENVYCIGGNGSLHSTIGNSTQAAHQPSYFKADGTTEAVKDTDYFIGATVNDVLSVDKVSNLDKEFRALVNRCYIFASADGKYKINSENAEFLAKATSGDYVLTEDINLANITWTPTSTFKGTLDGQGFKISNLNGSLFKTIDGAKISNLILDNVTNPAKGVFCSANLSKDIEIENVIVKVTSATAARISLLGAHAGGTATLKNVVVDMFAFEKDTGYKGFLTSNAGRTTILENVYCIGGNGYLHAPDGQNDKLMPSYFKADGTTAAVEGTDYFIGATVYDLLNADKVSALNNEFKALVNRCYLFADADGKYKINSKNVELLAKATSGDYVLTEDVDLANITWTPTSTFTGTLDGQGFKISNLNGSLFKTIDGAKISNLILDNVTNPAKGVFCSANLSKNIVIENVIVKVTSATAARISLLGTHAGGTATLKNVVVDMFAFEKDTGYKGFLTSNAGRTTILENVYCIGGNGHLHAPEGQNDKLMPSYFKADGTTAAAEDTDYFIYTDTAEFKASNEIKNIGTEFKALVDKAYEIAD